MVSPNIAVSYLFVWLDLEQELDPPRMCALDLPGEHAEDDDLGEPDPTYFGSHPDELEARPTGLLLFFCWAELFLYSTVVALTVLLSMGSWNGHDGACPRAWSMPDLFIQGRTGIRVRNNADFAKRWRARAQVQAYRLEQRLASFFTTPEQDAYLLAKAGPAALSAIPRRIVTFRMLRKRALQVRNSLSPNP